MSIWRRAAVSAAFCIFGGIASAQNMTLVFTDGSLSVSGKLNAFDGEFYDIDTGLGPLTVAVNTVQCLGDACPDTQSYVPNIRIAGSAGFGQELIPKLVTDFALSRGWTAEQMVTEDGDISLHILRGDGLRLATFSIALSTTSDGFAALAKNAADIAISRRAPTEQEEATLAAAYRGGSTDPLRRHVIGWQALRLFTNTANPVSVLTVAQMVAMLGDPTGTWPDDAETPLYLRGDIDSIMALRQQIGLQDDAALTLDAGADTDPGVMFVKADVDLPLKPVQIAPTCGAVENTVSFVPDSHPLLAPISLISFAQRHPPIMRDFLDFTLTISAQRDVADAGFVSRDASEVGLTSSNGFLVNALLNTTEDTAFAELQSAVRALQGYNRLSLSFRFEEGTLVPDPVSRSNLAFAAALLQQPRFSDRAVLFAGFSDGVGASDGNLTLSRDRARVVRDAIRTLMGSNAPPIAQFAAQGFGEALPLACNDTQWGQFQNRRVEIWVR